MKRYILVLAILLSIQLNGQTNEEAAIMKVVNQVFKAMRTSDSVLLKDAFIENPATYTVFKNKEGVTRFIVDDFQKFISAVGQPKEDVWNEPIWNEKIEIDGPLAQVWVDYAFYLNDQFSHCGVDAFHLVKQEGKWRIFHLVDTRRRTTCILPEDVQRKYEGKE